MQPRICFNCEGKIYNEKFFLNAITNQYLCPHCLKTKIEKYGPYPLFLENYKQFWKKESLKKIQEKIHSISA